MSATATATKKTEKSAKASKPVEAATARIPEFTDSKGTLIPLKRSEFPKTREGRMAFCDYNVEKWMRMRVQAEKGPDSNKKKDRLEKKLAAMQKREAELMAELAAL